MNKYFPKLMTKKDLWGIIDEQGQRVMDLEHRLAEAKALTTEELVQATYRGGTNREAVIRRDLLEILGDNSKPVLPLILDLDKYVKGLRS